MEEDRCWRCGRNSSEVKLLDAIYDREIVKICEECSFIENLPVIRKATTSQLERIERRASVHETLSKMAGIEEKKQNPVFDLKNIKLDSLRKRDYRQILDSRVDAAKLKNKPVNLLDNYNWIILMERKRRKMMRNQLAGAIGESDEILRMIENKELPDDALRIIMKIEQYLGIPLRKDSPLLMRKTEQVVEVKITKPEIKLGEEKFSKRFPADVTIDDLRRMKEDKERERKLRELKEGEVEFSE